MYTSGTTGDPKGVMISNESIITLIAGMDRLLHCVNEQLHENHVYLSYLHLAHTFDRVIEELFIFHGASIGFWHGIWIYGNSFESFLVAIVNPNKQALEHWAEENGIGGDFAAICENPKAKEYILGELAKIAKAKKLKGFEFIKAVHLDPVPFDMERDLLTPTYKKKRPQLLKYYETVINGLYKNTR